MGKIYAMATATQRLDTTLVTRTGASTAPGRASSKSTPGRCRRARLAPVVLALGLAPGLAPGLAFGEIGGPDRGESAPAHGGEAPSARHADMAVDASVLLRWAEAGDAKAAWLLGTRYASGRAGVRDDSEALRWFRRAADLGLAEAQYNLAIMHSQGRAVAPDMAAAARWFEAAAIQGLAPAQFNLGTYYLEGRGVGRDDAMGAKWLAAAADSGLPAAQYNLAVLYERGRGVRADREVALGWYRAAAGAGFAPARIRLSILTGATPRVAANPTGEQPEPGSTVPVPNSARDSAGDSTHGLVQRLPAIASTASIPSRAKHSDDLVPDTASSAILGWKGDFAARLWSAAPGAVTAQLLSGRDRPGALDFVRREGLAGRAAVVEVQARGAIFHAVVYGVFESKAKARANLRTTLGPSVAERAWIRTVAGLRKARDRALALRRAE